MRALQCHRAGTLHLRSSCRDLRPTGSREDGVSTRSMPREGWKRRGGSCGQGVAVTSTSFLATRNGASRPHSDRRGNYQQMPAYVSRRRVHLATCYGCAPDRSPVRLIRRLTRSMSNQGHLRSVPPAVSPRWLVLLRVSYRVEEKRPWQVVATFLF